MTHTTPSSSKNFSFNHRQYLSHKDEPAETSIFDRAQTEINAEILRTSFLEKRKFRRIARRLRLNDG